MTNDTESGVRLWIKSGGFIMNKYEEGMKILNERSGNSKDNVISLATMRYQFLEISVRDEIGRNF